MLIMCSIMLHLREDVTEKLLQDYVLSYVDATIAGVKIEGVIYTGKNRKETVSLARKRNSQSRESLFILSLADGGSTDRRRERQGPSCKRGTARSSMAARVASYSITARQGELSCGGPTW